jgi:hypothetical protein
MNCWAGTPARNIASSSAILNFPTEPGSSLLTLVSGGFVFRGSGSANVARTLAVSPAKSGATGSSPAQRLVRAGAPKATAYHLAVNDK